MNSFTLCWKQNALSNCWQCEAGYKTLEEADKRADELITQQNNIVTRIYPFSSYYPRFLQRWYIQCDMIPSVTVSENKI